MDASDEQIVRFRYSQNIKRRKETLKKHIVNTIA